jgi:hypothetical protein
VPDGSIDFTIRRIVEFIQLLLQKLPEPMSKVRGERHCPREAPHHQYREAIANHLGPAMLTGGNVPFDQLPLFLEQLAGEVIVQQVE